MLGQETMSNAFALAIVERSLQRFLESVNAGYGDYWILRRGDAEAEDELPTLYWSDQDADNFMIAVGVLARERKLDPVALAKQDAWPQLEASSAAQLVTSTNAFLQAYHAAAPPAVARSRWPWIAAGTILALSMVGIVYSSARD